MTQHPKKDGACQRYQDEGGMWVCDYCGSAWFEEQLGASWAPLSCPRRLALRDRG